MQLCSKIMSSLKHFNRIFHDPNDRVVPSKGPHHQNDHTDGRTRRLTHFAAFLPDRTPPKYQNLNNHKNNCNKNSFIYFKTFQISTFIVTCLFLSLVMWWSENVPGTGFRLLLFATCFFPTHDENLEEIVAVWKIDFCSDPPNHPKTDTHNISKKWVN